MRRSLGNILRRLIFELFVFLMLLEIGLRIGGVIYSFTQEQKNIRSLRQKGSYRIMCAGESTTALGGEDSYPSRLQEVLNERNPGMKFSVINKGMVKADMQAIVERTQADLDKYRPDMVITMMGINEYGFHMPYADTPPSKAMLFLRSFKTYELVSLSRSYLSAKLEEKGFFYSKSSKPHSASPLLKKTIELNPGNDEAYVELGWVYFSEGDNYAAAEESFKKAIKSNPESWRGYAGLGWSYLVQHNLSGAEDALRKAAELNPENWRAYNRLADAYFYQGKLPEAEEACKRALELDPLNDRSVGKLATVYEARGDYSLAEEYFNKANELRMKYHLPPAVSNYKRLKEALDKKGIYLICVQYPMRSIEPLKKIFKDHSGVIFVDNERIFKEAVKNEGYKAYFADMVGGDFGHCTPKGNRLLAENIAKVILKEVFAK